MTIGFDPAGIYTPYAPGLACPTANFVAGCYINDGSAYGATRIRYYYDQATATNAQANCGDDADEVWFTDLADLP